jgi:TRAP-type C4-dicarboxylate transport system permease small subunit
MDRIVSRLALASAWLGGAALVGLILLTCASIVGRALSAFGLGAVEGDYEMVEAGIGFAVFAFLPIAQLKAEHATVDLFTSRMSPAANRVILAVWEVLAALILALLAWRLYEGTRMKLENGETSFLLQFPVWWGYAACLLPAVIAVIVAIWSAYDRSRAALTGHDTRPLSGEAGH